MFNNSITRTSSLYLILLCGLPWLASCNKYADILPDTTYVGLPTNSMFVVSSAGDWEYNYASDTDSITDCLWGNQISTYAWKAFFQDNSNAYVVNTLTRLQCNEVFVSPGDDQSPKVQDFLQMAEAANISVARLLGENSYVEVENGFQKLESKMQNFKNAGFTAIHLDIEPHALTDYKQNIELYTERFNTLILLSSQWCDQQNMELSISIPMHTQPSTAALLAQLQIKSYIMAYENADMQRLLTRTASLRDTLQGLYVWVVRAKDFNDLEHLQSEIDILNQNGVYKLGIYDINEIDIRY